jgi:hypothetical protein
VSLLPWRSVQLPMLRDRRVSSSFGVAVLAQSSLAAGALVCCSLFSDVWHAACCCSVPDVRCNLAMFSRCFTLCSTVAVTRAGLCGCTYGLVDFNEQDEGDP